MIWTLIAVANAAPEACEKTLSIAEWSTHLDVVETAFATLDEAAFDAGMQRAALELPCVAAPLEPVLAGRYHRLVALRLYVRGDGEGARLAFAASRAVDPFSVLPSSLLPPGHEARALELEASTPGKSERAPLPRDGELFFDGRASNRRPVDRPTLMQLVLEGELDATEYLAPDQALPAYPRRLLSPPARLAAGGSGLVLGAVASTLVVFAAETQAERAAGADLDLSQQNRLEARTQGFTLGAVTSGSLAVTCIVLAAIPW